MRAVRRIPLSLALIALGPVTASALDITETRYEGRPHFMVRTERATWLYDRAGGGFSRLVDREGRDWINFGADPLSQFPESAAAGYRGLPNLVFVGPDKGAGHPGFDRCTSEIAGPDSIRSVSRSGLWAWSWTFTETIAVFEMEKADPDHPWWFLYEGPIAGTFAPGRKLWGTNQGGPHADTPAIDSQRFDRWRWIYFGDRDVPRVLFLAQHEEDDLPDTLWFLGSSDGGASTAPDGMVVFGFGRGPETTPQLRGAGTRVTVGLLEVEPRDHAAIALRVAAALAGEPEAPDADRTIRAFSQARASEVSPITPGRRFRLKARVRTLPDGRSRYRVRQWVDGEPEPSTWAVESVEANDEAAGSMLVVPHNTDVTVHQIHVEPLAPDGAAN